MTDAEKLARLIADAQAMDGQIIAHSRSPFSFARWLEGVNDGIADAIKHEQNYKSSMKTQAQGNLL